MGDKLRETFFPAVKDEAKVVAAFCDMSKTNALKKKPKVGQRMAVEPAFLRGQS